MHIKKKLYLYYLKNHLNNVVPVNICCPEDVTCCVTALDGRMASSISLRFVGLI
jgi:hypothetical protein